MTGFLIAAAIVLLLVVFMLLPVKVFFRFEEQLSLTVKLAFFSVFQMDSSKQQKKETSEPKEENEPKEKKEKNNFVKELFQKKGAKNAIELLFGFAHSMLLKLKKLLGHFVWDKLIFHLSVASDDAAKTAVFYGEICTAAYPVFSFLDQFSNVRYKEIHIFPDFTSSKTTMACSFLMRTRVWFLLRFALGAWREFLSFRKQVQEDE